MYQLGHCNKTMYYICLHIASNYNGWTVYPELFYLFLL